MPTLGVNIDHVATVRQARRTDEPSPVWAAVEAELGGADGITFHLREDRRHINDDDARLLCETVGVKCNMEMSIAEDIVAICARLKPAQATLVPERREELTTEGGLDVVGQFQRIADACGTLGEHGIRVSLFIDADSRQVEAAARAGAPVIEIHTGHFADARGPMAQQQEFDRIKKAVVQGLDLGLQVNADRKSVV